MYLSLYINANLIKPQISRRLVFQIVDLVTISGWANLALWLAAFTTGLKGELTWAKLTFGVVVGGPVETDVYLVVVLARIK